MHPQPPSAASRQYDVAVALAWDAQMAQPVDHIRLEPNSRLLERDMNVLHKRN